MKFGKFVTSNSSWKNEVDIKSVDMMSWEFELGSEKSMHKILIAGREWLSKWGVGNLSWNH